MDPALQIQERGEIFFFYRPKVNREEAHSADDVQRLYIVLRPESGEKPVEEKQDPTSGKEGAKKASDDGEGGSGKNETEGGHGTQRVNIEKQPSLRFIVTGRKSLPEPSKRSLPHWGFVEMVTTDIEDVKTALQGEEYDSATRGRRHKPPARAAGEGIYRILRHNPGKRTHTHLIYKLGDKEPKESLSIEREGSFVIQVKNPEQQQSAGSSGFRGLQSKRKAVFPAHLQAELGHRRFAPADPPDFLNYEGCELLLISASADIEEELGLELGTEAEKESEAEDSCSDLVKTFRETASPTPLLEGRWA